MSDELTPDIGRTARIGLPEAIYCGAKSAAQIERIVAELAHAVPLLLTRLEASKFAALDDRVRGALDYDALSGTAFVGAVRRPVLPPAVAIVTAGTSDAAVAGEARRTLAFHGQDATLIQDVGVAGLWRLLERRDEIAAHVIVIAIAGMEGALFSVLGGLLGSVIIAVPTSTGYGVGAGGIAALHAGLASCAPGILTVNIDNGYGAACAALRILGRSPLGVETIEADRGERPGKTKGRPSRDVPSTA